MFGSLSLHGLHHFHHLHGLHNLHRFHNLHWSWFHSFLAPHFVASIRFGCSFALVDLVLVEVVRVTASYQIIVLFAEQEYCKSMPKGTHVIQDFAVSSKPRKGLLSYGGVQVLDAFLEAGLGSGVAWAILGVTIRVEPVQTKVLQLLQSWCLDSRWHVVAGSVHDKEINVGVLGQDFQQGLCDNFVSFRFILTSDSKDSAWDWVNHHEPTMTMTTFLIAIITGSTNAILVCWSLVSTRFH